MVVHRSFTHCAIFAILLASPLSFSRVAGAAQAGNDSSDQGGIITIVELNPAIASGDDESENTAALDGEQDDSSLRPSSDANTEKSTSSEGIDSDLRTLDDVEIRPEPLSPQMQRLQTDIQHVLEYYRARPEDVSRRSPWGIMHAMIAFEVDSEVRVRGKNVNALGWLCWNGQCAGQQLMGIDRRGRLATRNGPGVQGHEGQFLAMLAQCGVRPENELRVNNRSFTVADLVELEKRTCKAGTELTFKLIGLSYYLDSEDVWTADDGSEWNVARLIREELAQPVIGAACGGTHRMMGFSFALSQRRREGMPIDGQWLRAEKYVNDFVEYTYRLQNPDGSFSTQWFEGRGARNDAARRIQTTGHILEWLVFTAEDDELDNPKIVAATRYLTNLLWQSRNQRIEIGPKGHALHALLLYQKRRFEDGSIANVDVAQD